MVKAPRKQHFDGPDRDKRPEACLAKAPRRTRATGPGKAVSGPSCPPSSVSQWVRTRLAGRIPTWPWRPPAGLGAAASRPPRTEVDRNTGSGSRDRGRADGGPLDGADRPGCNTGRGDLPPESSQALGPGKGAVTTASPGRSRPAVQVRSRCGSGAARAGQPASHPAGTTPSSHQVAIQGAKLHLLG